MPRQRNIGMKNFVKQKRLLATKLIKISIRLEDYIYNNKPISAAEAEKYIEEITKYRQQCLQDERSLQVIEKLTRCMNGIIIEQRQLPNANKNDDNINNNGDLHDYSPSPVYSLPDDDRTQVMEYIKSNPRYDETSKDGIEIIDLCQDDDEEDLFSKSKHLKVNIDVEMHRATSNLVIFDNDPLQITPDVSSQSILNNFEHIHSTKIKEAVDTKNTGYKKQFEKADEVMEILPQKISISSTFNNDKHVKSLENEIKKVCIEENKKTPTKAKIEEKYQPRKNNTNGTSINLIDKSTAKPVVGLKKTSRKKNIIRTSINLLDKSVAKPAEVRKKTTRKNNNDKMKQQNLQQNARRTLHNTQQNLSKVRYQKSINTVEKAPVDIELDLPTNEITMHQACVTPGVNNPQSINTTVMQSSITRPTLTKSMTKIYNEHIENDLSWMENIRYVREVTTDENDLKLIDLEDSFWYNSTLPNNWDKDFGFTV